MYQQPKIEGKIHLRVVVISVLVIAVILGLVAAIIVVANSKTDVSEETIESNTTLVDNGASEVNVATTVTEKAEGVAEESKEKNSDSPYASNEKTETTNTTTKVKDLPKTGPEDLLPLALVGGALVAYGVSALKTRRK